MSTKVALPGPDPTVYSIYGSLEVVGMRTKREVPCPGALLMVNVPFLP
jgi:hypothetical protein